MAPDENVARLQALISSQRHSFLNHLQVLSGWLQLGRHDRARQYLEALSQRLSAEAEAVRNMPPNLGLAIQALGMEAESHGVQISWRIEGEVAQASDEQVHQLYAALQEMLGSLGSRADGERALTVTLGPGGRFHLHTQGLRSEA